MPIQIRRKCPSAEKVRDFFILYREENILHTYEKKFKKDFINSNSFPILVAGFNQSLQKRKV